MRTIIVALALVTLACAFRIPTLPNEFPVAPYGRHSERRVQSDCPIITLKCVAQGGDCTFNFTSGNYPLCVEGSCTNNVCPTVPALGEHCTDECQVGLTCHPVTSLCVVEIQVKPPGASCTSDDQCLYSVAGASDVRSSCVSGSCFGIPLGGSCTGPNQCSGRAYCNGGNCVALQRLGDSCTTSSNTIAAAVCNSGTVIQSYSLAAGSPCTAGDACAAGLYCNSTFSESGYCLSASSGGGNICQTNADCVNGGTCACSGSSVNTTCPVLSGSDNADITVMMGLANCVDSQLCAPQDFACITSKCKSQYCAYRTYLLGLSNKVNDCYSEYLYKVLTQYAVPAIDCSSNNNNAAIQQVASFAVTASMTLAVVLL